MQAANQQTTTKTNSLLIPQQQQNRKISLFNNSSEFNSSQVNVGWKFSEVVVGKRILLGKGMIFSFSDSPYPTF